MATIDELRYAAKRFREGGVVSKGTIEDQETVKEFTAFLEGEEGVASKELLEVAKSAIILAQKQEESQTTHYLLRGDGLYRVEHKKDPSNAMLLRAYPITPEEAFAAARDIGGGIGTKDFVGSLRYQIGSVLFAAPKISPICVYCKKTIPLGREKLIEGKVFHPDGDCIVSYASEHNGPPPSP